MTKNVPLLILDIDGTVRQGVNDAFGRYCNGPADVRVFPEVPEKMRNWRSDGGRIIGVSNQGGIALGFVTKEDADAAMVETHKQCYFMFDKISMCPHHPEAKDPIQALCWCRKPKMGGVVETAYMLTAQFGEHYPIHMALMVGDQECDKLCAESMGIHFMWAQDWRGKPKVVKMADHAKKTKKKK